MQPNNIKIVRKRLQIQQGVIALSSLALLVFVAVWFVSTIIAGDKYALKFDLKPSAAAEKSSGAETDSTSKDFVFDDSSESQAAETPAADTASSADTSAAADSTASSAADSSLSDESGTDGEPPYESAALKDDFSDACFIGDSRTVGLEYNSDKAKASFFASTGLNVSTAFTESVCTLSNGNLGTVIEAVGERKFHRVFIMFGINELGWPYPDAFVENYVELIKEIKKAQPDADIYVESVLPVSTAAAEQDPVFTNANIDAFNEYVKKAAEQAGVKYLEVNSYFKDETGNLPEDAAADGIHFGRDLCLKWIDILAYLVPQKEPMTVETTAPAVTTAPAADSVPEENNWDNGGYDNGGWDNGYGYDNGYTDYNDYGYGY